MDEITRRKTFQRIKTMQNDKFWDWMNGIHSQAYFLGQKHMREAMECIPGISKKQIDAAMKKSDEIREDWDGIKTVTIDETEAGKLFNTRKES